MLDGRDRLMKRGKFIQPDLSKPEIERFARLSSPFRSFVEECCVVDEGTHVVAAELRMQYVEWCKKNGQNISGISTEAFYNIMKGGWDLQWGPCPTGTSVARVNNQNTRVYKGLRLTEEHQVFRGQGT